jgi:phospho-N-acetylmuramoyl-pentapeptide-transferase
MPSLRHPGGENLMLLALAQWLAQDVRFFNVFNYITLRTLLAAMTALLICFAAGPGVIRWLAAKKIGQAVRNDGPQTHLVKTGTPTMGGVHDPDRHRRHDAALWADLSNKYVWTVLIVTLGYGIVGWYDDWKKVVYRDPKGLSAKLEIFLAVGAGSRCSAFPGLLGNSPAQPN